MSLKSIITGIEQVPDTTGDQPAVLDLRHDYSGDKTYARELRDGAWAHASVAQYLGKSGNAEHLHIADAAGVSRYTKEALFVAAFKRFETSQAVAGQSEQARLVTEHHIGRTRLLIGQRKQGLKQLRRSWQRLIEQPEGEDTDRFEGDTQLRVNILGGVALAEATYGERSVALKSAFEMVKKVPWKKAMKAVLRERRSAVENEDVREAAKRAQLIGGVLGVSVFRSVGRKRLATTWGQNNIAGEMLFVPQAETTTQVYGLDDQASD